MREVSRSELIACTIAERFDEELHEKMQGILEEGQKIALHVCVGLDGVNGVLAELTVRRTTVAEQEAIANGH